MSLDFEQELALLEGMTSGQLQERFRQLFGESVLTRNRSWLVRRIAWRMQALAEGDLSERARQRANELAQDADLRMTAPKQSRPSVQANLPVPRSRTPNQRDPRLPMVGAVLARPYKGSLVQVTVLERAFAYQGQIYQSLSAVARAITGSHTNGYQFFRLGQYEGEA